VVKEQVLADRYALVSPLGRGGMGQVWEALDIRLDRKVAVKLLTAAPASPDDLDARRFTREAVVTAGLVHPGVPSIFDAGTCDGRRYLVMEFIDGCTIGDLVAEQGPLPVGWAAGIAGQVAAVLAIAHQHGILHRDIKPQNVMVTRDGTAKILDFGVAGIITQRITSTGVTVGTPGYIAPEQLHNLPATPQTDLYALGCLLYEMLAGEPVFTATSPAGLIRMHLEQSPPPLRRRDVHPHLASLLWQLLDKNPARRPADARQAYDRLLPFVSRSGPLGDIDVEAGRQTGTQLYSRLLARLSGADPDGSSLPGTGPASWVPGTRNDAGWTVRHSLWLLPALLFGGFGAWLSFGYIAARHQQLPWLAAAAAYLALTVAAFTLLVVSPDTGNGPLPTSAVLGVSLLAALWPAAIIHTLWVNFTCRLPLLSTRPR
jgi:serine/threonine protein kinase